MQPDGTYQRKDRRGQKSVGSQMTFCEEAIERTKNYLESKDKEVYTARLFKPALPPEK